MSYPSPDGRAPAQQQLISNFTSSADLVDAIQASIYIPFYAGPGLTYE